MLQNLFKIKSCVNSNIGSIYKQFGNPDNFIIRLFNICRSLKIVLLLLKLHFSVENFPW